MRANYRIFRGTLISWEGLFDQAAEFATRVGPQQLISICHSADANKGVVTVWYWEGSGPGGARPAAAVEDIDREIEEKQQ